MNIVFHTLRTWFRWPVVADPEQQDTARIVHLFTILLFFALFVPTLIRPARPSFHPVTLALTFQQIVIALAFWLNVRGRTRAAVTLTVYGLLAMASFIILASDQGIHDIGVLIFPSALVVAGILLDRPMFLVFTACSGVTFATLVYLEISGVVISSMSDHTTIHDMADGIIILSLTGFMVEMLTRNLRRTIAQVRRSEAALTVSNEELHRQSRMLKESEARYRLVVETALDPIVSTDFTGRFLFVNSASAKLSGHAIEDLIGRNFFDFCLPDDRERIRREFRRQVTVREASRSYEFALRSRSGSVKWLSANVSLDMKDDALSGFHVVARDITDRRVAEDEVRRLNQDLEHRVHQRTAELEAAMAELQNISYSVSHDLRAPLRHIAAYVEMTQSHPAIREDATTHRNLQTVAFSAKWMGMLVDGLIDYLSIGQTELHTADVDLNELVRAVVQDQELDATGRFIRWKLGDLPTVHGDRRLLRQALVNVISNAVKFTQSRLESTIEVGTSAETTGTEYVLYVRDNGIGFDPQYQDRLFGLFQRLHSRAEHAGTGIGLANVRRIIHRHGGRVWADGAVDRGATFFMALPRHANVSVGKTIPVDTATDVAMDRSPLS